jgi:hypothetical protein
MATTREYLPPTSKRIAERQNDDTALRLLLAQRRLYSRAKKWQGLRWIGLLLLGVAAPFVSVIWPATAVTIGGVTGAWLFVGRTILAWAETRAMTKAAAVQEELDIYIFDMPRTINRTAMPSLEDIAALVGPTDEIRSSAAKEKLLDWYPIDVRSSGTETVAIAQRANASYTDRLIRTSVFVWAAVTIAWLALLIVVAALSKLAFGLILLGVIFPVLPAALDVLEYLRSTWRAARDRGDLARTIEARLKDKNDRVSGQDLLSWQVQMYDLRRTTPQLPDWLYKLTRKRNEAAMHSAADQLRESSK